MLRRGAVLFGQTQSALEQADWRILQDFMDDGMFQDYYGRIERIKREGNKYVFRQQEPPVVRIEVFREEGEGEYLNLLLKAHLRHYFVEGRTGKLLAGESMRAKIRWFRMIFFRPLGKKTLSRKT